jgi:hypothetical protein
MKVRPLDWSKLDGGCGDDELAAIIICFSGYDIFRSKFGMKKTPKQIQARHSGSGRML